MVLCNLTLELNTTKRLDVKADFMPFPIEHEACSELIQKPLVYYYLQYLLVLFAQYQRQLYVN